MALSGTARYELLEKLGAGAFSTVYRARDNELGREVAVKQIHAEQLRDDRASDRYWAEAQVLASLQHPHIVTIYDIDRSRGWLVLELMQASLRDRLSGRPMDVRALRTTLIHALKALKYLHAKGVIHSDINPGNLMVDHRKRVKLGDFGMSRGLAVVAGGIGRGCAKYMAPEALAGKVSEIGPTSDLYSLGFSCYELLCGAAFRDLFPGLDTSGSQADATWMMWHAATDRRLPPIGKVLEGVPPDLAAIIDRMIDKHPPARPQSADEILGQLGEDPSVGERDTPLSTSDQPPRQGPRPWVVAICLLSILLSLGMLFFPQNKDQPLQPPPPIYGVVRGTDLNRNVLEIEDSQTGIPEEFPLPAKPKILLMKPGEAEQFILARELQPGDWIEIRPSADPQRSATFKVARPVPQTGELRSIDPSTRSVTITIESGRLRDDVVMKVPERTKLTLNGQPAKVGDLREGDRLEVDHLLDPTGQRGHLVSALAAFRTEEVTGFITVIDLNTRQIEVGPRRTVKGERSLTLTEGCVSQLSSGEPLAWEQLRVGDRVSLQVDSQVRSITVTRGDATETGLFAGLGADDRTIQLSGDDRKLATYQLAEKADVRLHGEAVRIEMLRPQIDRLTLTLRDADGTPLVTALDAVRGVRHNRWAIVIGNGNFDDPTVTPVPHFLNDAKNVHQTLTKFYAVDPAWSTHLSDPEISAVREEIQTFMPRVTEPMQLIVAVFGHAYRADNGQIYLAFRDFQWKDPVATGLPLESLVQLLERCPAKEKLLLLDLTPAGDRPDSAGLPDLPHMLATLKTPLKTLRIIGASSEGERSHPVEDGKQGWFGRELSTAFRGPADEDRDLVITTDDLMKHLNRASFDEQGATPMLQHPFEWGQDEP